MFFEKFLKLNICSLSVLSVSITSVYAADSMNSLAGGIATGVNALAIGANATASAGRAVAVGENAKASAIDSIALGAHTKASAQNSLALGLYAKATNTNAVAAGYNSTASGMSSTAVGPAAKATGYTSTALGFNSNASAFNSLAIGSAAKTNANDGIAIGTRTEVTGAYSIALGDGAKATGETLNDEAYLVKDEGPVGELNIGKYIGLNADDKLGERRITGLAAGANDTDAVNVSQLKVVDEKVSAVEKRTDAVEKRTDALEEADKLNIKYSKDSAYAKIELVGDTGTVISNVADGDVSATSSEAINGSQLYLAKQEVLSQAAEFTNEKFNVVNSRVDELNDRVNKFDKDAKAGIASAIAIATLPQPTEKGASMLSLGTGVWEGESSLAIGASGVTEDKTLFKVPVNYVWKFASTTNSRSSWGGGASVGVQWK